MEYLVASAAALAATLLSLTSWGARPAWLLVILTLAALGGATAADLRRRGVARIEPWPLRPVHETLLDAAALVLLTTTVVITVHLRLGSLLWIVALIALAQGAWARLSPYADARPRRLFGGYRALAVAGLVLLLVAMTQDWGQGSNSLLPGYGYGCDVSGCGYGVNYGFGAITVFGVTYQGVAVEWAEWIVLALVVGLAALLATGSWRPAWLRFVPLGAAGLTVAWLAWALNGSILVKAGEKKLAWWVAIAALAAFTAGAALLAAGQEDGAYTPARLYRRLRGQQATS